MGDRKGNICGRTLPKILFGCKRKTCSCHFELKEVNRQVVLRVLDKIEAEGTDEFLACLEAWRRMEVKKVAARITDVETTIKKEQTYQNRK